MSFDVNWDTDKYKEDHESDEHWQLRKAFMDRWKQDYPEERLVCLARVFANIEFMGCRYPPEVMHEVSRLSQEVVQSYRNSRKNKLQRTFVSASTAAEDRAKGVKRQGGVVISVPAKSTKISFVRSGQECPPDAPVETFDSNNEQAKQTESYKEMDQSNETDKESKPSDRVRETNEYCEEMSKVKCLDVRHFRESMFQTEFGRFVLLIRPWSPKMGNIMSSCHACNVNLQITYANSSFSLTMNGKLVAQAMGDNKSEARKIVEMMAWNRLREVCVSVLIKEQWIAQGDARISVSDVSFRAKDTFGTPVENSVASKMMKMMGWKGGGLGAEAQGIEEPIKPNMQLVNRAGLGSSSSDIGAMKRAAMELMRRYMASDTFDLDLVFSSDFSKDERAALHQLAQRNGLASKSYGVEDRFLVVRKKLDPFFLVYATVEKGGATPKYQVFIPAALQRNGR